MAKPKKMTAKERIVSDVLIENIELLKKENGIKSDAECMRKIKEKTGFDFNQSKYSDIKKGKTFPTTMELIAFSDFFDVSIDFLLGKEKSNKDLTIFETCQSIVNMFESNLSLECTSVTVIENDFDFMAGYPRGTENTYNAIYFSSANDIYDTLPFDTSLEPWQKAERINDFMKKMIDINNIKHTISQDLYDKIVAEWLYENKVYDKMSSSEYNKRFYDIDIPFN